MSDTMEDRIATLEEALTQEVAQSEFLQETLADLELALDDIGWQRLQFDSQHDFTRTGLDRIIALSRLNALKNPLIRRGVHLKSHYVWGQGVEINARDATINDEVIRPFIDDRGNREALFASQASQSKDRLLTTDGNVAFVLVPNVNTGRVKIRSITVDELRDKVTNPEDRSEVWFYKRSWTERTWALDGPGAGIDRIARREAWYPDWRYRPEKGKQIESIGGLQVRWDTPIMHVKVGGLDGMRFGVPETYAALDWAKAYKLFLEDWATIVRSLSRFAWSLTVQRKPGQAATRLGSTATPSQRETTPSPVAGSTFVAKEGVDLTPISKSGATVASADGVWLAKMVGAALDVPYTILMGDPDMGNLATAKTLDRPTELAMMARQSLWSEVIADLCNYAVDWAARAPAGPIGSAIITMVDGSEVVTLADEADRTIEVVFPPILQDDLKSTIDAIVAANATELVPPKVVLTLILQALSVDDVDEIVDGFDEEQAARLAAQASAGDAAIAAFRQGQDPAATLA